MQHIAQALHAAYGVIRAAGIEQQAVRQGRRQGPQAGDRRVDDEQPHAIPMLGLGGMQQLLGGVGTCADQRELLLEKPPGGIAVGNG